MNTINAHMVIVNKVNKMMTDAIEYLLDGDSNYKVVRINYYGGTESKDLIMTTVRNFNDCANIEISMTEYTIAAKVTLK